MMTDYKFPVGATVHVSRRSLSGQSGDGTFKVLARYPSDTSGPLYRIRSVLGSEERMVPEHELSRPAERDTRDVRRSDGR
ncbi:hypothetical protein FFK22_039260 [Mycobacterium sp. KBS0706]|uniref:hypothetical protein n=1 Tax=Mycobacterium sp. KBS0706 TaxID=2578109 RepID=UPI00110FD5E4|nr:hypothetical protein [Mycobacterium sp. KBS0706]TSD83136.1 hypothetical protein FFK22_039260 [Mycobacterium sp. KBS0706]